MFPLSSEKSQQAAAQSRSFCLRGRFGGKLGASNKGILLFVVFLGLTASLAPKGWAQEQETRMQQILNPSRDKSFVDQSRGFINTQSFQARKARVKEFQTLGKFRSKDYLTGRFKGEKAVWMGDFVYDTKKPADVDGRKMTKEIVKDYGVNQYDVSENRNANKGYETKTSVSASKEGKMEGKSQDKMDKEGPESLRTIPGDSEFQRLETIEDIRNLLNKTK